MSKQVHAATCAAAADGGKQLAGARAREYLFTNNPLFTSDGRRRSNGRRRRGSGRELALNETADQKKPQKLNRKPSLLAARSF